MKANNKNLCQRTKLSKAVNSSINIMPSARSAVLGLAIGTTLVAPSLAFAQQNVEQPAIEQADIILEEIVVSGIRSSLERASQIKRNADGVVDAISAEDIGVFPDTNLAESLQRITGVSIDRSRGEGSRVTVRGFGPEFNLVTLNGRQLPNHSGDTRSFDFGDLASEAISGVEVFKSGRADATTGGIGSTINIKTSRPLESPGLKSVVQVKSVFDTSTETGSDVTPEVSGIYSNTFAGDRFGIAITGSFQDRNNGVNTATVGDYNGFDADFNGWGSIPDTAAQINRPSGDGIFVAPQSIGYEIAEFDRERINGQLTLQWQATESLRATIDYTYSEVELERTFNNFSSWFNFGDLTTEFDDGPIASPIIFSESGESAVDFSLGGGRDGVATENNSVGLNLDWQVNDRLSFEFDYHNSDSESGAIGNNGTSSVFSIASFTREQTTGIFDGGDIPVLSLEFTNPLTADDFVVTGSVFNNEADRQEIEQTAVNGKFAINDASLISFGVQLSETDNRSQFSNVQRNTWGGTSDGTTDLGQIADLLTPASLDNVFDQFGNGSDPRLQSDFFTFDIDELVARTTELGAEGFDFLRTADGPCGTGLCASNDFTTDRITNEESTALFVQLTLDRTLGDTPIGINLGLRYEETDVTSAALVPAFTSIVQAGDGNEFNAIQAVDDDGNPIQDFTQLTGEYDVLLPNLDIRASLSDKLVARFSYSETISRPNFTDIQGGVTISSLLRQNGGDGQSGNPALLPFESENIDLSLEYYFNDSDFASAGYFRKDVSNFIGTAVLQDQVLFPDLIFPTTGEPATFDVTTPVNQEEATIDGWELAIQKTFGDSGFGFIANATIVDGDVAFDSLSLDTQFVLRGLSDSANLIGFYEKNKLQVRLAYNWRDDFFNGIAGAAAGTPGPVFIEAFGQLDFSAKICAIVNLLNSLLNSWG